MEHTSISNLGQELSKGDGRELVVKENSRFFLINDDCNSDPIGVFIKTGKLMRDCLTEVDEETALRNFSKAILYGFTNEQVKSFFIRANQIFNLSPTKV
jgi:hypothetical protein